MPPAVRPLDMPQAGHMRVTCSPEGCGLKEHGRVERKGVEQAVGGRSGDRKGECVQPEESTVVLTSGYCTTRRSWRAPRHYCGRLIDAFTGLIYTSK